MKIIKSSVLKAVQFSRLANSYRGNPMVQLTWEELSQQWSSLAAREETLSREDREREIERLRLIEDQTLRQLGVKSLAP